MVGAEWQIELGGDAERDFEDIPHWTTQTFGPGQRAIYAASIGAAIKALARGPNVPSAKRRGDIGPGLWTLHVGTIRRRARHFLLYEVSDARTIRVLRILHDSMDLQRHRPSEPEEC